MGATPPSSGSVGGILQQDLESQMRVCWMLRYRTCGDILPS